MSDQWYYQLFGEEFGPVKRDSVSLMLSSGQLGPEDLVRHGNQGAWVTAGSVAELQPAGAKMAVNAVAANSAEVADDIDSFLLIDERAPHPAEAAPRAAEMATDIDSFMLVDEQQKAPRPVKRELADELSDDLANDLDLDSFRLVEEQSAPKQAAANRPRTAPPRDTSAEEPEAKADPDAAIWYFQGLDTELGPVPRSELVAMVRRTELGPKDLIRKGKKGRWLPSELLEGLFAEAAAPPPVAPIPAAPPPAAVPATPFATPPAYSTPAPYATPAPQPAAVPVDTGEVIWYCYINDQEYGPMTMTDLRASAAQGSITDQSYVKYGSRGEWVLASSMPEIFPPPPPPPAPVPVQTAAFTGQDAAGSERNELVQQLLSLLKQGLSSEVLGGAQSVAPIQGGGWYCNISGNIMGPVSIESLVQMVLQKRLFPDDMIRMGQTGEWFPAKTVPDLFPATSQGRARKAGLDSGESVMERIDRMYREGQEAQARADALKPKNESVKPSAPVESSRSAAGDVLRSVSANIARGNTGTFNKPTKSSSSGSGMSFSGFEMSAKTWGIIGAVAVIALGGYFAPSLMSGFAAKTAFGKLVAIKMQVQEAGEGGMSATAFQSQSKDMLKTIAEISAEMKGGASGSAKRDVSRMARNLKEMIETVGKPKPAGSPEGTLSDFERATQAFDDSQKAAANRLGLK